MAILALGLPELEAKGLGKLLPFAEPLESELYGCIFAEYSFRDAFTRREKGNEDMYIKQAEREK
jgi:hypothetical protein